MKDIEKAAYKLRFENEYPLTYQEIAAQIGGSRQYAYQVVCSAIQKKMLKISLKNN